jgi:hypothetical protein
MKKVLLLLLLLIVACGGSSEETVVEETTTTTTIQDTTTTTTIQDTTTTTVPPAPTVDFNIVEIYNTKLGTDLCSDATEIDTTSEPCLKQYRDNLEKVFSYAENLETYISELNTYLESYPSAMTEEYTSLFQFVNDEYQAVPEIYGLVTSKYIERFGGKPTISLPIFSNPENLSVNCTVDGKFDYSENLKSAQLTYANNTGEIISFNTNDLRGFNKYLKNTGGTFYLLQSSVTNYLDETFEQSNNLENSFFIEHLFNRVSRIKMPEGSFNVGDNFEIIVNIEPVSPVTEAHFLFADRYTKLFYGPYNIKTNLTNQNEIIFYFTIVGSPSEQTYDSINTKDSRFGIYFEPNSEYFYYGSVNLFSELSQRATSRYYSPVQDYIIDFPTKCGNTNSYELRNVFDYENLKIFLNY